MAFIKIEKQGQEVSINTWQTQKRKMPLWNNKYYIICDLNSMMIDDPDFPWPIYKLNAGGALSLSRP